MPELTQDSIREFGELQVQLWNNAVLAVSENVGDLVIFDKVQTDYVPTSSLQTETADSKVVIQFSFSDLPDSTQIITISSEALTALASVSSEGSVEFSEELVTQMRPVIEAFVQGLCTAVGGRTNEAVVASGLSIRLQNLAFPINLENASAIFSTSMELQVGGAAGRVLWFVDADTASAILGIGTEEEAAPRSVAQPSPSNKNSLEILMDIPLQISVELGRVKMIVKDVIELGSGSIIEIDKAAGEPVDVLVNGNIVARGEVVVIEDNFGIRITEILNQQDRLARLKEVA